MRIMKQSIPTLALLALSLLSTSCVPAFKNPLPAPKEMKPDAALLGSWESVPKKGEGKSQVSFFGRKSGWIDIVFINDVNGTSSTDGVNISIYEAYTATIGKNTFLCLRGRKKDYPEQKDDLESGYLIAHYLVSKKGDLSVNLFDKDAIKKMIANGVLKGEHTHKVTVEASSDELVSAITEKGLEAFISADEVLTFKRVGK
jgi:hypothetical protein